VTQTGRVTQRGEGTRPESRAILASYLPRLVEDVQRSGSNERLLVFDGSLVSADISGFTALSERLAGLGHEGAEELTDLLNRCFGRMIDACESRGGDIVKFGGDALLVLFTDDEHAPRAVAAMDAMRSIVAQPWSTNSVGRVRLGISQGAHSGAFGFSLVDGGHLELLVGGPSVSTTIDCESAAARGEILVSQAMAELLPPSWLGRETADGARPIRRGLRDVGNVGLRPLPSGRGVDGLERFLAAPLIDQVLAGSNGEHRQVAVAFVNVGATDDLFFAEGPLAVHEACQAVADNLREVLTAHPVHLLASDAYTNGAKLIITAGAPISTDADDDHLLLALHDLFSRPSSLPLRAGVNRGHVYVGDLGSATRRTFTVMGDAVNLAARLMQKAQPGQIVASAAILGRAVTDFECAWLEPFMVKGKSKPIDAAVVRGPIGAHTAVQDPSDQVSAVGFVGRHAELELLDRLAAGALDGHGAVAEIIGEAGIGKSRLVREALTRRPELSRVAFRGGQYAKNSPYYVIRVFLRELMGASSADSPVVVGERLRAWVRSAAPDLEVWMPLLAIAAGAEVAPTAEVDRIAEEFRRDRLLDTVADAIDAALSGPAALIVEDAHLVDSVSGDVLGRLVRRARSRPWVVLLVHRGDEGLLPESVPHDVVELHALAPDEARDLVVAASQAAGGSRRAGDDRRFDRLAERGGGHPLYLLELLSLDASAGVDDALPESIESLVTTRIDKLPAQDRLLLREAAVAGLVIDTTLIAESFDRPELARPERWHALRDFLEPRGHQRFRFRQDLYRAVAYEGLAYRRRREAHLVLGQTLEQRFAGDLAQVASLLSTHFDRGRDGDRAWVYSVLAGDTSRHGYANDEAAAMYRRALAHARTGASAEPTEVARVAEALGDVYQLGASYRQAIEAYQLSRRRGAVSPDREARVLRKIGYVREREGQLSQALRWYSRAQRRIDDIPEGRERRQAEAETALSRAGTLNRQGRNRESARFAELAARSAEAAQDRVVLARAYNILEVAYSSLGRAEAAQFARKALEMYEGSGDLVGEANVLNNLGVQAYYAGDWNSAVEYYRRSRDLRRQAGDLVGEAMAANNLAEVYSLQGHFDEARDLFEFAQRTWESAGYPIGVAYVTANLAMVEARSGAARSGLAMLGDARYRSLKIGASSLRLEMDVRRVECLLLAGDVDRAMADAIPLLAELTSVHEGDEELTTQLLPMIAIAHIAAGDHHSARECLQTTAERATADSNQYIMALVSLVNAELMAREGLDADAMRDAATDLLGHLGVVSVPSVLGVLRQT
jgi:class 3 adenylate cyclase/tetratricopeptide (TPR) repeat protein